MHGPAPRGATLLLGALVAAFGCALATRASAQDPVRLLPDVYKVILDNCQLRVMDYHLKVGQKEPMHSHPAGVFVYFFTDAKLRVTLADGKAAEATNRARDTIWREPVTHVAENIGPTEVHALLVEPKHTCK